MERLFARLAGGLALALLLHSGACAQDEIELKLAYFVGDQHAMSKWLIKWSQTLERRSHGRIVVKRFPAAQLGPTQQHYDLARTGQADAVSQIPGLPLGTIFRGAANFLVADALLLVLLATFPALALWLPGRLGL